MSQLTDASMTVITEALQSKRRFVLDMLGKYHKTHYDSQELKDWASDLHKELDAIDAALAELAQRAKPDAHFDDFVRLYGWNTAQEDAKPVPNILQSNMRYLVAAVKYAYFHKTLDHLSVEGVYAAERVERYLDENRNLQAEGQPVPVESLRRLLALCRSRYETTGRLGYELVEVEAWLGAGAAA